MNLYITFSDKNKIKKCFLNLRKYLLISSDDIIRGMGFDENNLDICTQFMVNEEIKRLIRDGSSRRKLLAVIYSNPEMNDETVRELIHYANSVPTVGKVIFLVDKYEKEAYYELFEEVLYFPAVRKVHIVECEPIPANLATSEYMNGELSL